MKYGVFFTSSLWFSGMAGNANERTWSELYQSDNTHGQDWVELIPLLYVKLGLWIHVISQIYSSPDQRHTKACFSLTENIKQNTDINISDNTRPSKNNLHFFLYNYNIFNNTWIIQGPKTPKEADLAPWFSTTHLSRENTNE